MTYPLIKPIYYLNLLKQLISFIKNPELQPDRKKSIRMKVYDTIGLFVLKVFFLVILALFMALVSPWFDPENISKSNMVDRYEFPILLLVGGFILPLVEEVCFRLSLRFRPIYLSLTSLVICYYLLTKLAFHTSISMVDESFLLRVLVSFSIGLFSYPIFAHKKVKFSLAYFWQMNVRWIYYISCLSFAFIHIFNYELTLINLLLLPLITLPQLMSAIINGYTRLAFGFQYPLLFHITNNLIAISLTQLPS